MPTLENQSAAPEVLKTAGHAFTVVSPPAHPSPAIQFRGMAIAWLITMIVTLSGFMFVQWLMYR
jgi:hypothetical protein